jgi:hypothetical protein
VAVRASGVRAAIFQSAALKYLLRRSCKHGCSTPRRRDYELDPVAGTQGVGQAQPPTQPRQDHGWPLFNVACVERAHMRPLRRSACGWTKCGVAGIGGWLDVVLRKALLGRLLRTVGRGNGLKILRDRPGLARHLVVWLPRTTGLLGHAPTTPSVILPTPCGFPAGRTSTGIPIKSTDRARRPDRVPGQAAVRSAPSPQG